MKWEVITTNKRHVIEAKSSATAVLRVKETDSGFITSCKLLPNSTVGKARRLWRKIIGK